jgi:hypothetical protein
MKFKLGVAAAALVALIVPGSISADTSWQGFGSATGTGRGDYGSPWLTVNSTTRRHPTYVRVQFRDSTRTKRTNIRWDIFCWTQTGFRTWDRGGNGDYSLPRTITWDVPNWVDYCEVDASAYHFDAGSLSIRLQARYP